MVAKMYIPERGDIVWVDLNPTLGHEQSNVRPALVLSPQNYNQKTSLCIVCPITSQTKGYPFEVAIKGKKVSGCALSDHIRNIDWKSRNCRFVEKATTVNVKEVTEKLTLLIS